MAVTITELARILNLDHSTVAYALSGKGTIKPETRRRVQEKAAEMGYVPNALARRMRSKRTGTIGLVVPDVVLVYSELVQQLFRAAAERGCELQIALTEFSPALEERAVLSLLESRVDGIIIKSQFASWDKVPERHALRQAQAAGLPVVTYGYPIEGSGFPCFRSPTARQSEMLAEHLLSLGRRDLAWLFPVAPPLVLAQEECIAGTRAALAARSLDPQSLQVLTLHDIEREAGASGDDVPYRNYISQALPRTGIATGRALLRAAMSRSPRPNALLCQNEATAVGAILEAGAAGLRVPGDVAVAVTSHTAAAEFSPLALTACDPPTPLVAARTLDLLFHALEGHGDAPPDTAEPVLRPAASTVEASHREAG